MDILIATMSTLRNSRWAQLLVALGIYAFAWPVLGAVDGDLIAGGERFLFFSETIVGILLAIFVIWAIGLLWTKNGRDPVGWLMLLLAIFLFYRWEDLMDTIGNW